MRPTIMQEEMFARYEAKLDKDPTDRTALVILKKAVSNSNLSRHFQIEDSI